DPRIVAALANVLHVEHACVIRQVKVAQLADGMYLADDVRTIQGTLLCAKGQEMTASMRARLRNYVANVGLSSPIKVFVRVTPSDECDLAPEEHISETAGE
ncbi:MAG: hypothetical protein U1E05_11355, partial [Patescibacteria group bacterium]|nr:hypothetical protein [Patescibacteria group bacterium]